MLQVCGENVGITRLRGVQAKEVDLDVAVIGVQGSY